MDGQFLLNVESSAMEAEETPKAKAPLQAGCDGEVAADVDVEVFFFAVILQPHSITSLVCSRALVPGCSFLPATMRRNATRLRLMP